VEAEAVASAGFVHRVSRALDPHLHSGIGDRATGNVRAEIEMVNFSLFSIHPPRGRQGSKSATMSPLHRGGDLK